MSCQVREVARVLPRLGQQQLVSFRATTACRGWQNAQARRLASTWSLPWSWFASKRAKPNDFPTGIKTLYEPSHRQPVADIVFVHGLMGDREKTWSAPEAPNPWAQTLLPSEFPDARILTFGYNALVAKWPWGFMVSQNQIDDHAFSLLLSLAGLRREGQKPPIIFICHSLGGIVCMDALVQSRNPPRPYLKDILRSTRGIAFMGTPHHIVSALQLDSEVLERIRREFHNIIKAVDDDTSKPSIEISCFYEQLPSGGIGKLVVPQWSATLDRHVGIGIHSDHTNMTKFETKEDHGFTQLCDELRHWVKNATNEVGTSPAVVAEVAKFPHQRGPLTPIGARNLQVTEPQNAGIETAGLPCQAQSASTVQSFPQPRNTQKHLDGPDYAAFGVAIICALGLEAEAIGTILDRRFKRSYGNAEPHSNSYSCGTIGRHNVVLVHPSEKSIVPAAQAATNCRNTFKNIKLTILAGICGAVPFYVHDGKQYNIAKGDIIIGTFVAPYDQGKVTESGFKRDGKIKYPPSNISSFLHQLRTKNLSDLQEKVYRYTDTTFEATHDRNAREKERSSNQGQDSDDTSHAHLGELHQLPRAIHFGGVASGGGVIKSKNMRDEIATEYKIIAVEMEAAGIWDHGLPCMVIKGVSDYADHHKDDTYQQYAAATAAACTKAVLDIWRPLAETDPHALERHEQPVGHQFIIPYPENEHLIKREDIMERLAKNFKPRHPKKGKYHRRVALCGRPGVGKTQIALAYARWLKSLNIASVFWVRARSAQQFRQSFEEIARTCSIQGDHEHLPADVLPLVKEWLESERSGKWLMIVDSADDAELFFPETHGEKTNGSGSNVSTSYEEGGLGQYLPQNCHHGAILITTVDRKAAGDLASHNVIDVPKLTVEESAALLRKWLGDSLPRNKETDLKLYKVAKSLSNLPFALGQAAAYMQENYTGIDTFVQRLERNGKDGENFIKRVLRKPVHHAHGRDGLPFNKDTATMYLLSFGRIREQDPFAADLLSFMSLFDREDIPVELLSIYRDRWRDANGQPASLLDALGLLKRFGHIKEDRKGVHEEYDMGRIEQMLNQEWLEDQEGDMCRRLERDALFSLVQALSLCRHDTEKYLRYLPHVVAVQGLKGTGLDDERQAKAVLRDHEAALLELERREALKSPGAKLTDTHTILKNN